MKILAVNPWIFDFAAFDFWLKPYGFLQILTYLKRKKSVDINYIDCLDSTEGNNQKPDKYARKKFPKTLWSKPSPLEIIPKNYYRYGISDNDFSKRLKHENYDYILLTSSMTYWYNGIEYLLSTLGKTKSSEILIGGNYVNLLKFHAQNYFKFARFFTSQELKTFFYLFGTEYDQLEFKNTLPDYFLFYQHLPYVVLRTSYGCPFDCHYCGIRSMEENFYRIPVKIVADYLEYYYKKGIKNFVFYDDALFFDNAYMKELLSFILKNKFDLSLHTPNGLHLSFIDKELADLMHKTNFVNPHLSVETITDPINLTWHSKFSEDSLLKVLRLLKSSGYKSGEISSYLLFAYPGQNLDNLLNDIDTLHKLGIKISLSEFSPVYASKLFPKLMTYSKYDLNQPLFHNNSIFPFYNLSDWPKLIKIKDQVRLLNSRL